MKILPDLPVHFVVAVLCCLVGSSCATWRAGREAEPQRPLYAVGTYHPGSNITEPRPRRSQFLETVEAGFVVLENGAAYYLEAKVRRPPPGPYYIRVEFENPLDKDRPLRNDLEFSPGAKELVFTSPGVVKGIRAYDEYAIRVKVYPNRDSDKPLDILEQPIRSYVDTRTPKVGTYRRLQVK